MWDDEHARAVSESVQHVRDRIVGALGGFHVTVCRHGRKLGTDQEAAVSLQGAGHHERALPAGAEARLAKTPHHVTRSGPAFGNSVLLQPRPRINDAPG